MVPGDEVEKMSSGYLLKDGALVQKWTPPHVSTQDDWGVMTKIVVPKTHWHEILKLAHANPLAGHLRVN